MSGLALRVVSNITSAAGRRVENQDRASFFPWRAAEVFVVADGMGGYEGGALAAQLIVDRLPYIFQSRPDDTGVAAALQFAVQTLNAEVCLAQKSNEKLRKMGSTLVVAVRHGISLWIASVGDSRAYLFRNGELKRLTTDHTVVQNLLASGELSEADAQQHPQSSMLTRVIGQQVPPSPDLAGPLALEPGDEILLCSDGLSGCVSDRKIAEALQKGRDVAAISDALVDLALNEGSTDNITVQYLRFEAQAAPPARRRPPREWVLAAIVLMVLSAWWAWRSTQSPAKRNGLKTELPLRR
jgi:serine/threonine protein phosphatase PrpC